MKVKLQKTEWWPVMIVDWKSGEEYEVAQDLFDRYWAELRAFKKIAHELAEAISGERFTNG